jgi:hypothetical protein
MIPVRLKLFGCLIASFLDRGCGLGLASGSGAVVGFVKWM